MARDNASPLMVVLCRTRSKSAPVPTSPQWSTGSLLASMHRWAASNQGPFFSKLQATTWTTSAKTAPPSIGNDDIVPATAVVGPPDPPTCSTLWFSPIAPSSFPDGLPSVIVHSTSCPFAQTDSFPSLSVLVSVRACLEALQYARAC